MHKNIYIKSVVKIMDMDKWNPYVKILFNLMFKTNAVIQLNII